jgi:hypothetical protein
LALEHKLNILFKDLHRFLSEKKLISRLELRLKINQLIEFQNFTDSERRECEKNYNFPLPQFIFLALTSGTPQSIQAPLLHEKTVYKEMLYYYSHTFPLSPPLLEQAHSEVCQLQKQRLETIISKFFLQLHYEINILSSEIIQADQDQLSLTCFLFCSILNLLDKIDIPQLTPTTVLIIPPGATIKPFIEFYQKYSNQILLAEANIWLIDTETEILSTFIGMPKDKNLLVYFTKSKLATQIERLWRPNISEEF